MMYKPSSITDFFKPFAQPRQNKRPLPSDDPQESIAIRPSPGVKLQSNGDKIKQQKKKATLQEESKRTLPTDSQNDALNVQQPFQGADDVPTKTEAFPSANSSDSFGSQGPVLTSSQRVVKNGEVMVTNSEDEASDSDDSLDDIDELLASKKAAEKSSPPTEPELPLPKIVSDNGNERSRTRRKTRGAFVADERTPAPPLPKYKFSLESLVRQSKSYVELETQTAKARMLLQSLEQPRNTVTDGRKNVTDKGSKINEELVVSVMQQHREEGDVGKLMTAIERTEALYQGVSWSFFDVMEDIPKPTANDFPQIDSTNSILGEAHSRQQAFLSGYVGEIAEKGGLPKEILVWIIDSISFETRDDLNRSYILTLKDAGSQITSLLTPERLDTLFYNVGASRGALNRHRPIIPRPVLQRENDKSDRPRLLPVIYLLRDLAIFLSAKSRVHAIHILWRLLIDDYVTNQCPALIATETAFASLIKSIPEMYVVCEIIYTSIADQNFRLRLLRNIPASSPRLSVLRRRLSLAFFFQDIQYLNKQPKALLDLRQIARHLQKPQFVIRVNTDYAELSASISILSIGVDAGDPPSSSHTSQKASFNAEVDLLSDRIKAMFTQIIDTGASHMRRTEAKEILESFHSRLLYAVRTKRKPKTMLLGDLDFDARPDSRQGAIMMGFLEKARQNTHLATPGQE